MASFRCAALLLRAAGGAVRRGWASVLWLVAAWLVGTPGAAAVEIELPQPDRAEPVVISAEAGNRWNQGEYEVWVLRGHCRIGQGASSARSREAVLWIDRAKATQRRRSTVIAYLEGDAVVELDSPGNPVKLTDQRWFGRFFTATNVQVHVGRVAGEPDVKPGVYLRGMAHLSPPPPDAIRRTQYAEPGVEPRDELGGEAAAGQALPPGTRRAEVYPRGMTPTQLRWEPAPNSNQWVGVVDGGVVFNVHTASEFGILDISADRLVIWTTGIPEPDVTGQTLQGEDVPLEIYMEGNIIFRQGDRVIYAKRMYYDVRAKVGTVLDAEMLTRVRDYEGWLRLRAEVLQQIGQDRYFAQNAFLTSSRMGRPGYRIQSGNIYYEDIQRPAFEPWSGEPVMDPTTGQQVIDHERMATSQNNLLFLGDVPIFYWPTLAAELEEPTLYIRRARVKNDQVFGTQVLTDWNAYELLGIRNAPEGTDWNISLDYLSKRGFGHGTTFTYQREGWFLLPGPTAGLIDYWGVKDSGLDNLGRGRSNLVPEADYRHRLFWQHRQQVPGDFQLTGELGWISDRDFLEEYFKREWDELKDETTGLELKRTRDNIAWSISADTRLNEFFTQTEWLPRGDHFWLGQSLLRDTFTWYEHSSAGFGRLRVADPPRDPVALGPWHLLPWEQTSREGERLVTRQEIDWPLQLGPVKAVPYGLGELAHWGEDLSGDDLQRAYWQAGIRASMPMWRADPLVESPLLNVHGLAHKVVFDAEFCYADSNRDLDQLPLYDPLDDDSIEAFRRRLSETTYGLTQVPERFDSRYYALRSGMAGWVTAPSTEIADDLMALRTGIRQRWQTKRGMPGKRRIIDWIVLDTSATWFPDRTRDNYGEVLGLWDYDFRWHVGDRLTFVSDGIFDFFPDGQRIITFGGFLSRPPRGSLYLGMRLLEGPISHQILAMSYSYHMSPKWLSSFGMSIDLADDGNIGQQFTITRIGESLLISAGFTVDAARNNVGVSLAIEPRFLTKGRLGNVGAARIPAAGLYGLE